jgi:hypothetical protein
MATTTPNFGWPVPTSTDLVKNGATAIEALGDAIDASLVDLEGGTTGQVLAKASNTDMDFAWVAQDDSNAIQNSIVNAKGDLIGASANDVPAILSVGSNGETLVADSSTSTGLRYQGSMAAGRNFANNGGFDIWQRGTSIAAIANDQAYTADRWKELNNAGLSTYSRQATGDTTNLPFVQYCMRVQRNSGQTATGVIYLTQSLESVNSIPLAGRTVTFSFYARAGSNYSATSNILSVTVNSGTGTDQNINQGFTGSASVVSQNATLTTSWQRFTYTGSVASTATQLGYFFSYTPTGTASTNDYFEVTGVQLELGSVATTFMRQGGTIQGELSACMRYFQMSYQQGVTPGTNTANGANRFRATASTGSFVLETAQRFIVPLRVSPTFTWYSTAGTSGKITNGGADLTVNGTYDYSSSVSPYANTASSITAGNDVQYHFTASAEL